MADPTDPRRGGGLATPATDETIDTHSGFDLAPGGAALENGGPSSSASDVTIDTHSGSAFADAGDDRPTQHDPEEGRPDPAREASFVLQDVSPSGAGRVSIPSGATAAGPPTGQAPPEPTLMPTIALTQLAMDTNLPATEMIDGVTRPPGLSHEPEATVALTAVYDSASKLEATIAQTEGPKTVAGAAPPKAARRGPRGFPTVPGYEILSELGRGGMGVVYKAHHQRLDILVALKMIIAGAHASSEQIERFEGEARAVARLRHPNIVQVYHVDELDGLPFFSLEFIEGGTLRDRIDAKPLRPGEAAEYAQVLAGAIAAAHKAGIIHRDLKPANVLMTQDGVPKITDFGLAKRLEEDDERAPGGSSAQTRTGAIMGTPSYMAPEQAWGKTGEIGPLADQYALGAMLYEMLTGRPPFQGANPLETLEMVRKQDPVPPSRLNPKVPADLETICLKALEKEPARRYADVSTLADDLQRFIEGRPIEARPVSAPERAWRWCRRNPRLAGLIGSVAALLLLMAVGSTAAALVFRHQKQQITTARNQALENEKIAVRNEGLARASAEAARKAEAAEKAAAAAERAAAIAEAEASDAAITSMDTLANEVELKLRERDDLQGLRSTLLATASTQLERIPRTRANAVRLDTLTASTLQRAGDLNRELNRMTDARAQYERMNRIVEALLKRNPDDPGFETMRAAVSNTLGDLHLRNLGNTEVAQQYYQQAYELRRKRLEREAGNDGAKLDVANSLGLLAGVALKLGDPRQALAYIQEERALRESLSSERAKGLKERREWAGMLDLMGTIRIKLGELDAGRKLYAEALALREAISQQEPDFYKAEFDVYLQLFHLGQVLVEAGELTEALHAFQRGETGFENLLRRNPQNANVKRALSYLQYGVGAVLREQGEEAAALEEFRKCHEIREALAKASPQSRPLRIDLAIAQARSGDHATASKTILAAINPPPVDNQLFFQAACTFAQCAEAARTQTRLAALAAAALGPHAPGDAGWLEAMGTAMATADATSPAAAKYADNAMTLLDRAAKAGWRDAIALATDPDLSPLRDDPRFRELVKRLVVAAAPLARRP